MCWNFLSIKRNIGLIVWWVSNAEAAKSVKYQLFCMKISAIWKTRSLCFVVVLLRQHFWHFCSRRRRLALHFHWCQYFNTFKTSHIRLWATSSLIFPFYLNSSKMSCFVTMCTHLQSYLISTFSVSVMFRLDFGFECCSNSQRHIVHKIYYAHKSSTSFVPFRKMRTTRTDDGDDVFRLRQNADEIQHLKWPLHADTAFVQYYVPAFPFPFDVFALNRA